MAVLVLGTACTDFVEPKIPYKDFDHGTYLRTISRTSTEFNFNDLENSNFALTLEAVDDQDGRRVSTLEVRVRLFRVTDTGVVTIPAQGDELVLSLGESDFAPNSESRFLRTQFSIPATDAISALGLTPADIQEDDFFDFRLVLTTKEGRVFTDSNASADIRGGFFYSSPFLYRVQAAVPGE
ncbi:MAG: hypothetical protein ACLFQ0_19520 [Cyclobacteriaceae bacterium]